MYPSLWHGLSRVPAFQATGQGLIPNIQRCRVHWSISVGWRIGSLLAVQAHVDSPCSLSHVSYLYSSRLETVMGGSPGDVSEEPVM